MPCHTCRFCGRWRDNNAEMCRRCRTEKDLWSKHMTGRTGAAHPCYKGNPFTVDKDGYFRIYAPNHPWKRNKGIIQEHVRVMELHIGHRIEPDEIVHHEDHNRQNNNIENLRLMKRGEHSSLHRLEDTHKRLRDANGRFA